MPVAVAVRYTLVPTGYENQQYPLLVEHPSGSPAGSTAIAPGPVDLMLNVGWTAIVPGPVDLMLNVAD